MTKCCTLGHWKCLQLQRSQYFSNSPPLVGCHNNCPAFLLEQCMFINLWCLYFPAVFVRFIHVVKQIHLLCHFWTSALKGIFKSPFFLMRESCFYAKPIKRVFKVYSRQSRDFLWRTKSCNLWPFLFFLQHIFSFFAATLSSLLNSSHGGRVCKKKRSTAQLYKSSQDNWKPIRPNIQFNKCVIFV